MANPGNRLANAYMSRWTAPALLFSEGLKNRRSRYGIAAAIFIGCLALRLALRPLLGSTSPFGFFYIASTVASLAGGLGPGLAATLLGAVAGTFFLSYPWSISEIGSAGIIQLVVYLSIGTCISLFGGFYRQRTRELHESQQQLEAVFRQASAGLVQLDADGRVVLANERFWAMSGRSADSLRGTAIRDLVVPDDRAHLDETLEVMTATGRPALGEVRAVRPDGSEAWLQVAVSPLVEADGHARGSTAVVLDVSPRKAAEARLAESDRQVRDMLERERLARSDAERASRLKEEFLSTLSHELRTPLNAILGWAHLLQETAPAPKEIERGLTVIERNARAQATIIDGLLDMSSIITGKMRLEMRYVALDQLIEAAAEGLMPAFQAKGVQLVMSLDRGSGLVMGDQNRLTQILWNLLSNALKFTSKGDRVEISLRRAGSKMQVTVRDTGKGIARRFLPHVFERFRQQDASPRRAHGGLGIGLAITKSLAELHGGTIAVTSEGEGRGSQFTVALPIAATPEPLGQPPPVAVHDATADAACLNGVRVLVVDDDEDNRLVVRRLLVAHGAEVNIAGSASEAVESCERFRPHVLLTDLGMPERDGYQLLTQIRAWEAESGHTVAAAALTALTRSEDRRRAMLAGFQVHVAKPVEPPELVAVVAGLAGRTRRVSAAVAVERQRTVGGER
jgi:PAS domain S-box-containing protein